MEVRFVIVAPPKARKAFKVRLPVVVGRGEEAKFRIQQDSVSRRHCEFAIGDGVVTVTDLGSTNGTLVAGARIEPHAATAVASGTEVQIGGTVFKLEYAAPAAGAPREVDTMALPASPAPVTDAPIDETGPEPPSDEIPEDLVPEAPPVAMPVAAALERAEPLAETEAAPAVADQSFPDVEPAAAATDFGALAGADEAPPPAEGSFDFLGGDAPAPPPADDKLDDFFKSLS